MLSGLQAGKPGTFFAVKNFWCLFFRPEKNLTAKIPARKNFGAVRFCIEKFLAGTFSQRKNSEPKMYGHFSFLPGNPGTMCRHTILPGPILI